MTFFQVKWGKYGKILICYLQKLFIQKQISFDIFPLTKFEFNEVIKNPQNTVNF